jgi:phage shock protein E
MAIVKVGAVIMAFGFLANFFSGGGSDKALNLPALVQDGALVVDVRTSSEFSRGHIEEAVNIPYDVITREIGKHSADKEHPVIVYCHSGSRSAAAKRSLESAGYTRVVNGGSFRRMNKLLGQ